MIRPVIADALKSLQGRRKQALGRNAELLVRARLIAKGLSLIERIETGWKKVGPVSYVRCGKVSGDWRAVGPGGISVLVESKYRNDSDRLPFSVLERHQATALNAHHIAGGISLLAWCHPRGVHVLRWPIDGFERGTSLPEEQARANEWMP